MLRGEVWEVLDPAISVSGEHRGQILAPRNLQPSARTESVIGLPQGPRCIF